MKCKQLILIVALVLGSFSLASGQNVWVDMNEVQGLTEEGLLPAEGTTNLIIPVHFTNNSEARSCISNGFVFTSDNVTFGAVDGYWNDSYPWDLDRAMQLMIFPPFFDVGLFTNYFEDGVGMAGLSNSGSGLPAGFDDIAFSITVADVSGGCGEVLTMDSSFWMPANVWLWCGEPTLYPPWGGPYEFEVEPSTGLGFAGDGALPTVFSLRQNYPNPFNPTTEVHFDVPTRSNVKIDIYNVLGHKVKTLVNEEMAAGSYIRTWDGNSSSGNAISSGVYLYKMEAGTFVDTKKMMMLK